MSRRTFSLSQMLLGVTLASFLTWAVASPSPLSCMIGVLAWSFAGAIHGWRRDRYPYRWGAAAGAAAVVTFVACYWAVYLLGYFLHDGPDEYFEDGFAAEAMLFPIGYCVFYAPLGALHGLAAASLVDAMGRRFSAQPPGASPPAPSPE